MSIIGLGSSSISSAALIEKLHCAIEEVSLEKVDAALANGADVNGFSKKQLPGWQEIHPGNGTGNSALHLACWLGSPRPIVDRLLQAGADVHLKSLEERYTCLHVCSSSELLEFFLVDYRCNANEKSRKGYTPLMFMSQRGLVACIDILIIRGGAKVQEKNNYGSTALMWAVQCGFIDVVSLLIDKHGASIIDRNTYGEMPLHLASLFGHRNIVQLLLDKGSNIHEKESDGGTPLHFASQEGNLDVVGLLLEQGANIHEKEKSNSSSLHQASYRGHKNVVSLLLAQGAKIHELTNSGHTSAQLATHKAGNEVVVSILERWPEVMLIVVLQDLFVYNYLDLSSLVDFMEYRS